MSKPVVLIVEDEPLLRLIAVALIEDAGCAALEAGSADEAIAQLEHNADISAVFTDIGLPGEMDGRRLAAVVRRRWPPVELILTSGHTRIDDSDLPEGGRFLPKPYTATQLADALHAVHIDCHCV